MCGIAGFTSRSCADDEALCHRAQRMANAIKHRGPDGCGVRAFAPERGSSAVALAHRRLAIIDLSDCGLQPMCNEDGTVWVVFNGEIYNFAEHRRWLLDRGHGFRSATDTEVLVHLYEELGPRFVERLTGMFAFAILDKTERRLMLARDQIGIKPLFYSLDTDGLAFGSEIKALLAGQQGRPNPNWQAIHDFFTYLYVPGPQTAFEGIEQLPPAHILTFELDSGRRTIERYWQVKRDDRVALMPRRDAREELLSRLGEAVRGELVSDVPLGLFLSGGIDSAVLAGLATHAGNAPRTYTVDFSDPDLRFYSEAREAEITSRYLGTEHRTLDAEGRAPLDMLHLIEYFDEPFGNPTFLLQWMIAAKAREHITVALSGAGGDELFAGYPRYRAMQLSAAIHRVPKPLLRFASRSLRRVRDTNKSMHLRRARELLEGLDEDPLREFLSWTYYMNESDKARLLGERAETYLSSERVLRQQYRECQISSGGRFLQLDVQTFLVDNLLNYTDRMSMAVGMEVRVPFLEADFVQFALNLPMSSKLGWQSKGILRDTFAQFLVPSVRRGKKRGFNAPLGLWMRNQLDSYFDAANDRHHPLRERMGADIGISWRDEGLLNSDHIELMRREHREGRQDLSHELFAVIMFDLWWRKYITGTAPMRHWGAEASI